MGNTFIIILSAKVAYKTLYVVSQLWFLKVWIESDLREAYKDVPKGYFGSLE